MDFKNKNRFWKKNCFGIFHQAYSWPMLYVVFLSAISLTETRSFFINYPLLYYLLGVFICKFVIFEQIFIFWSLFLAYNEWHLYLLIHMWIKMEKSLIWNMEISNLKIDIFKKNSWDKLFSKTVISNSFLNWIASTKDTTNRTRMLGT